MQMKENYKPPNGPSPFDQHKRSRSSNGKCSISDPLATLQRQLQELAQQTNSYAMRESFVKQFLERLNILETLTKKCESILNAENKRSSSRKHPEDDEECKEKLRFIESHIT